MIDANLVREMLRNDVAYYITYYILSKKIELNGDKDKTAGSLNPFLPSLWRTDFLN